MENVKKHWKLLQELESDLANRVRSFMVVGRDGEGLMIVTEEGEGFWLGEIKFDDCKTITSNKPTPLDVSGLVQMAKGNRHILLLNKQGEIYGMGLSNRGQLGLGSNNNNYKFHTTPHLISIPHKFTSVRCGLWHSLALTEDGMIWGWGNNVYGEVGVISSTIVLLTPHQIPDFDPNRVVAIECGAYHSLGLTDQGDVYGWGWNKWGQLGHEKDVMIELCDQHTPTRITIPGPVKSIAAGLKHTLLLTRSGEVYACGANDFGQLGLRTTIEYSARLSKVAGLPSISQIASHLATDLSIAMSIDQQCFVWGELLDQTSISTPLKLSPVYSTVESPLSLSSHRNTPHSVLVPETLPNRLSTRMSRMFDNPESSDVQFVVEQRTIHAHRIILSNSSDHFARMFSERWLPKVNPQNPILKVTISDHSFEAFYAFLRFLYTDCFEVHPDLLLELFELALFYLEFDLYKLCLSRMRTTLTPITCCLYYQLTHRHSLPELDTLQQELVQFASIRMSEVVDSATYQSMEPDLRYHLTNAVQNFQTS